MQHSFQRSIFLLVTVLLASTNIWAAETSGFRLQEETLRVGETDIALYASSPHGSTARGIFVYSHGMTSRVNNHHTLLESVHHAGFDVIAYDLPGHGKSERYRHLRGGVRDFELFVDTLSAVIDKARKLFGKQEVYLAGWSLGGLISTVYLQRHHTDIAGSVLYSPGITSALMSGDFTFILDGGSRQKNLVHDHALAAAREADETFFRFPPLCLLRALINGLSKINSEAYRTPTLLVTAGKEHFTNNAGLIKVYREAEAKNGFYLEHRHHPASKHDLENDVESDAVIAETINFLLRDK